MRPVGYPGTYGPSEVRPRLRIEAPEAPSAAEGKPSFKALLAEQVEQVNQLQLEADKAVGEVATGQSGNLHEAMVALDRADLSFKLLTQVRNKAIEAYQEIMRMNI